MKGMAPKLWPGETFCCLGSGPSLTQADVDFVRGKARVIAINTSYKAAPWADVLFASDVRWWRWFKGAPEFKGLKFSMSRAASAYGVTVLTRTGDVGLELDPHHLRTGRNGGYQAINLAVHLGAKRIVLLGYDMKQGPKGEEHWHGEHPNRSRSQFAAFLKMFEKLPKPLADAGVEVINCTRSTALKVFPCRPLNDVFAMEAQVA